MGRGVDIPWIGGQNAMGRGVKIPWVGGQNTMGRGGLIYMACQNGYLDIVLQLLDKKVNTDAYKRVRFQ
jgi:hypothetical protein